jgi:type IV pilus assembly protein PilA
VSDSNSDSLPQGQSAHLRRAWLGRRINRARYSFWTLLVLAAGLSFLHLSGRPVHACRVPSARDIVWTVAILTAALGIFGWLAVRRLHDINLSGWWAIAPLLGWAVFLASRHRLLVDHVLPKAVVAVSSQIVVYALGGLLLCVLVLCLTPGTRHSNRYGPMPPARRILDALGVAVALAVLATVIVFPTVYADYTFRSRVSDGLNLASAAKSGVSESFAMSGEVPSNNGAVGLPPPEEIASTVVQSVAVGNSGTITVTLKGGPSALPLDCDGATIIFTPLVNEGSGAIDWDCQGGTLPALLRPSHCKPER